MQKFSNGFGATLRSALSVSVISAIVFVAVAGVFPGTARAAAGEGSALIVSAVDSGSQNASTATYGSPSATGTATVGSLGYLRVNFTVGASGIAGSQNNMNIQVPTNLFATNGFDTNEEAALTDVNASGEFFIAYTDTDAGTTNNAAISFAASAATNTGLITIQANQQMDATDIISIYIAVNDLNHAVSVQTMVISVDDTGANSLTPITSGSPTVTTQAADAAASVTLGNNAVVASNGPTTLTLTVPFALDANDTIDITFPAHINVSGVGSAVTGTFEATDSITCASASQVVTCTTSAATNTTGTIVMTGIRSSSASATDITSVEVENEGVAANDIATDTSVSLTNSRRRTSGSDTPSSVVTYDIRLTAPAQSATYTTGSTIEILWSVSESIGTIGAVNLDYSVDNGTTWVEITTNTENDGAYTWTAPNISSEHVLIRAEGTDLVTILDTDLSEAFTITNGTAPVAPSTPVTSPSNDPTGELIKGSSSSAVYAVAKDGTRRPFLDAQTYFTHYANFNGVVTVSDEKLASYTLGKPMLPKAGIALVKVQSVNDVYVVTETNTLRKIASEEIAKVLFGDMWADYVIDVPVTAWSQFDHTGSDINTTTDINVSFSDMRTRMFLNTR